METKRDFQNRLLRRIKSLDEGLWGRVIFPVLLFLLPLRHVNQGIDVSDTGYNLACFAWFGELDGMWVYVSYLANAVGHFFTTLPFGNTLLGMNVYCSLVVSVIALLAYYFLQKKLPVAFVFAGEVLAIMLCWCPQVILYNYLTYLALMAGTLLLYRGIFGEKKCCLMAAGLVLGVGVSARFSNLTHMALILGLWYHAWLVKKNWRQVLTDTLYCAAGYGAGIIAYLVAIQLQYGLEGYWSMLFGLKTMSSGAEGYSTAEMLTGAFVDYLGSLKWGVLFALYGAAGWLGFRLARGKMEGLKKAVFVAGLLVLFRFVYGRGMFGLDYHTYFSIFWWVSLFNAAALVLNLIPLFRKGTGTEERVLCALIAITILILPLGSNNRSYPVINNLFLIAPMTLYQIAKTLPSSFPVRAVAAGCLATLFIQSIGFGCLFVFRDGAPGEKRDAKVENNGILKGMYTTADNAQALREITHFCKEEGLIREPVILYGDIPGLSYILQMPSAITSTWANLDSYNMTFWERDFGRLEANMEESRPVVMLGKAYLEAAPESEKTVLLRQFLEEYEYETVFENGKVLIYR